MVKTVKERVISIRVTPKQYQEVQEAVTQKHMSMSTLGRVLMEMFLRREVNIYKAAER